MTKVIVAFRNFANMLKNLQFYSREFNFQRQSTTRNKQWENQVLMIAVMKFRKTQKV